MQQLTIPPFPPLPGFPAPRQRAREDAPSTPTSSTIQPISVTDGQAQEYLRKLQDRIAHDEHMWGAFPGDGTFQPVPAGESTLDLRNRSFTSENLAPIPLRINPHLFEHARVVTIVADTYVKIDMDPNLGQFLTFGAPIEAQIGPPLDHIRFYSDVPYTLIVVFGTGAAPGVARAVSFAQVRYSDTTVVKAAAAATADSLATEGSAMLFVPRFETKSLTQATFGKNFIRTPGWGQKVFTIRNIGAQDASVQLFGSVTAALAATTRWIGDTDAGSPAALQNVAAGGDLIWETSLPWQVLQMRAVAAAGVAAGAGTRLIVEAVAQTFIR